MTRSQAMWCLDFLLIYQVLENLIGFAQTGAHYELYSSPLIRYLFLTIF